MGIGSIGLTELLIIFGSIVLIFGGKKIPELAKGIGKGIREFKRASAGMDELPPTPKATEEIPSRPRDDD